MIAPLVSESGWTWPRILEQRYPKMSEELKLNRTKYWKGQHFVLLIASSTVSAFVQYTSRYEPICNLHLGYGASSGSYLSGRRTVYSNQTLFSSLEYLKLFICLILDGTPPSRSNASNKVTHTLSNVFGQRLKLEGRHRFRAAPLFKKFFIWVLVRIFPIWRDFSKSQDTMLTNRQELQEASFPISAPRSRFQREQLLTLAGGETVVQLELHCDCWWQWGTNCNTELLWK